MTQPPYNPQGIPCKEDGQAKEMLNKAHSREKNSQARAILKLYQDMIA
jgi:hypothetical protein